MIKGLVRTMNDKNNTVYSPSIPLQAQRGSVQQDELSPAEKAALTGEDQMQKITTYEEAFKRIKEATGVSDTLVSQCDMY